MNAMPREAGTGTGDSLESLRQSTLPREVALDLARAGIPVFPCKPDKTPYTAHGFKDATTDPSKVAAFWQANPRAMIGVPTGQASGLFVVDLDTEKDTGEALGKAKLAGLGSSHRLTWPETGTADALELVSTQTIVSPVKNFLESLSWDGKPRVADWLTAYCGAEPSDLTAKVGNAWLVSAVARALKPGCKADCALVLEGKPGAGKSSILRTLAGIDWFHDDLRDMHGKDASAALRGKWIIELPELSAMRRSDTEAVKAFLSRTEERYRPAYGRA